jgi:ElaB/YqjD/DUF883 family membrane-anchored ribosome-binding protein
MAEEPEVIREQIRETQESLASKLSTLEDKVVNTVTNTTETVSQTVESVKDTVADTIETVKDSVESTVQTVKRTFDLEYQVDQRPWLMMGASFAAGFLTGRMLPTAVRKAEDFVSEVRSEAPTAPRYTQAESLASAQAVEGNGSTRNGHEGWLSWVANQFRGELEQAKALAIGALFGLARDWTTQNLPGNLAPHVKEVVDNLATKLGGTHIESPVLENISTIYGGNRT